MMGRLADAMVVLFGGEVRAHTGPNDEARAHEKPSGETQAHERPSGEVRAHTGPSGHPRDPVIASWLGVGAASASGQPVTVRTALQASAVFACVRNTAETIASLPCLLKRVTRDDAGRRRSEEATEHPLHGVLLHAPNGWQTAFDFWEMVVEHLQLRGNHYSRIVRNGAGRTVALEPMHPDRVRPFWTRDRRPAYEHQPETGAREILLAGEVFHVRGPLQGDGLMGMTPIAIHRETIGMALASRDYGARLFANDARPRGVLEVDGVLGEEAFNRLRASWRETYAGENRHGVAILEQNAKFHSIGMTNEDAQYLETRGYTDLEIARLYRVPPYKIGILEKSTLNNVEQQNRAWVTDTLVPLARRIEDAIKRDLMTPQGRLQFAAMLDFGELLRGDVKVQSEAHAKGIQWGWYSPNDVRERIGENPIGPEGDVYVSPVNMQPMAALMDAGTEPPEPEPEPEDDEDEE